MLEWKECPTLPDYEASSTGWLRRKPWHRPMPNGGQRAYGGQPTRGQWDGARFLLSFKGRTYKVHRLICEAFHGLPPFDGAVVMHLDEDASNNHADNLAWGTQRDNLAAPGFRASIAGRVVARKIAAEDLAVIQKAIEGGATRASIAQIYGVKPCTISNRLRRCSRAGSPRLVPHPEELVFN